MGVTNNKHVRKPYSIKKNRAAQKARKENQSYFGWEDQRKTLAQGTQQTEESCEGSSQDNLGDVRVLVQGREALEALNRQTPYMTDLVLER